MSDSMKDEAEKASPFSNMWKRLISSIQRSLHYQESCPAQKATRAVERAKNTIANRYLVLGKLGSGAYGQVFAALDMTDNKPLAVKFASGIREYIMLQKEYEIYCLLRNGNEGMEGLTCPHYLGKENTEYVLIIDRHGPSLEKVLRSGGSICTRDALSIGIQALQRIQHIHSKGYIHCDIKPDNMVLGLEKMDTLYFIDYGLAKRYIEVEGNVHIPKIKRNNFVGTVSFSSLNTDKGIGYSRRDDLESIGLVVVYLRNGALPWSSIHHGDAHETVRQIQETKKKTPVQTLCKGLPSQVLSYFYYVRMLRFAEDPNYDALINLLLIALKNLPESEKYTTHGCGYVQ